MPRTTCVSSGATWLQLMVKAISDAVATSEIPKALDQQCPGTRTCRCDGGGGACRPTSHDHHVIGADDGDLLCVYSRA